MASFIISKDGELVAKAPREMKSGDRVSYSSLTCQEAIDANRESNLVNAKTGKISNAKKWEKAYLNSDAGQAVEINPGEFLI